MSRRGNCRDNTVEFLFSGLKKERIKNTSMLTGKPPRLVWPNTSMVSTMQYDGPRRPGTGRRLGGGDSLQQD